MVRSTRAGMGKSLYCQRRAAEMRMKNPNDDDTFVTLSLHKTSVNQGEVLASLIQYIPEPGQDIQRIFHIDIAHEVGETYRDCH